MAPKLHDLATADEDQGSCATKLVGLSVSSMTFIKPSAMDRHGEFDAHCISNNNVTGESAYVVVPATMTFKLRGKQITQTAAVFTVALRKVTDGWRIAAWAWAKGKQ